MEFSEVVSERRSIKSYDPEREISDAELEDLFEHAILSPSSFNLQHWAFVAVRDPELKKKLRAASWDQEQVETCSVAVLVCGNVEAHRDAPEIYQDAPPEVRDRILPMIEGFYEGNDQLKRDEAVRSASLAAMTLMYAAKDRGFDTGPMIGFDPDTVSDLLHLGPNYVPVMLVALGHAQGSPRPRDYRRPVEEVVKMNTLDGPGLKASRSLAASSSR